MQLISKFIHNLFFVGIEGAGIVGYCNLTVIRAATLKSWEGLQRFWLFILSKLFDARNFAHEFPLFQGGKKFWRFIVIFFSFILLLILFFFLLSLMFSSLDHSYLCFNNVSIRNFWYFLELSSVHRCSYIDNGVVKVVFGVISWFLYDLRSGLVAINQLLSYLLIKWISDKIAVKIDFIADFSLWLSENDFEFLKLITDVSILVK